MVGLSNCDLFRCWECNHTNTNPALGRERLTLPVYQLVVDTMVSRCPSRQGTHVPRCQGGPAATSFLEGLSSERAALSRFFRLPRRPPMSSDSSTGIGSENYRKAQTPRSHSRQLGKASSTPGLFVGLVETTLQFSAQSCFPHSLRGGVPHTKQPPTTALHRRVCFPWNLARDCLIQV